MEMKEAMTITSTEILGFFGWAGIEQPFGGYMMQDRDN